LQRVQGQTDRRERPGSVTFHYHAGACRQIEDELPSRRRGQVGHHAALRRVQMLEQRAVFVLGNACARCRPAPQRIAPRRLDLDDVGARIDEHLRAVRPSDLGREIQDPHVCERPVAVAACPLSRF
jgi:hypothetical protein